MKYKLKIFLIMSILLFSIVYGDVIIFEDFEEYVNGSFPSSNWTQVGASAGDIVVEETGAINGTKSLYINSQTNPNAWIFMYHDITPPADYCFFLNTRTYTSSTGIGFIGRMTTNDDGYALVHQGIDTFGNNFRPHEFAGGSITDAHSGEYMDLRAGTLAHSTIQGCFDGTTYRFNATVNGTTVSDSYVDASLTSGFVGLIAYMDTDDPNLRTGMLDNFCIYNGTSSINDCWNESFPTGGNDDYLTVNLLQNLTNNESIWFNWTTAGNYTRSLVWKDSSIVYNNTNKYFNNTGLINNTEYTFNLTVSYNNTLQNSTVFSITTNQNPAPFVETGEILIEEDFEDGTDDTFPARFTQIGSGNIDVETTGAINGTKSLQVKADGGADLNEWNFLYHDKTLPTNYCWYVNAKILGDYSGGGFIGRNPTGDDGYSLNIQSEGGTSRPHEWSGGSISDVHSGDYLNSGDIGDGDYATIQGCFEGTTYRFNITINGTTTSGSYVDITYTSGYAGFVTYMDTDGRDMMFDNFCVWNGTKSIDDCFATASPHDFLTVELDENSTSTSNIWFNWTTAGNYTNSTVYYNCSDNSESSSTMLVKYYNLTGMTNNTLCDFNITVKYNTIIFNSTTFQLSTDQNTPLIDEFDYVWLMPDSVTLKWNGSIANPMNASVILTEEDGTYIFSYVNTTKSSNYFKKHIMNLNVNTKYNYSVEFCSVDNCNSYSGNFTTRNDEEISFIVVADVHNSADDLFSSTEIKDLEIVRRYVLDNDYMGILDLGDMGSQMPGNSVSVSILDELEVHAVYTNYTEYNRFMWMTAVGNHEVYILNNSEIVDLLPELNWSYGKCTSNSDARCLYNTYSINGFDIISMGTYAHDDAVADAMTFTQAELDYLNTTIENSPNANVIIMGHQPLDGVSDGNAFDLKDEIRKVFQNSGKVVAVFNGHDHVNSKNFVDGVNYFQIDNYQDVLKEYVKLTSNSTHLKVDYKSGFGTYYIELYEDSEENTIPVIQNVYGLDELDEQTNIIYSNQSVEFYCNATDVDNDDIYYHWEIYNNTLYDSGITSKNYTSGETTNVYNLTSNLTGIEDSWTFKCWANDGQSNSSSYATWGITIWPYDIEIIDYIPGSGYVEIDEGNNYVFNITSIMGGNENYTFQWFLDSILQAITRAWEYIGSIGDYGVKQIQVFVNDSFGTGAQSINLTINVSRIYFGSDIPTKLTPEKGYYDYTIPVQCGGSIVENTIDNEEIYYYTQYRINDGSWNYLFNNTKGLGKFDLASNMNYNDTVDFKCISIYNGDNSTTLNPEGNITRKRTFALNLFDNAPKSFYIHNQEYQLGMQINTELYSNVSISEAYVDCNGDYLWDYYWTYNNTNSVREFFTCVNYYGSIEHHIGVTLEKDTGSKWPIDSCNSVRQEDLCRIQKTYELMII